MEVRGQVYLVDDEKLVRQATEQWLQLAGFEVTGFSDAASALAALTEDFAGVVISDVRMPQMDGHQLMHEALKKVPELPVILVTGHGHVQMAIQSVRDGAYDFIEKPYDPEILVETVHRACEKRHLMLENQRLQQQLAHDSGIESRIIGISPVIVQLRKELLRMAQIDTNLIIYGETGSGKELVAQCLHDFGPRQKAKFVPLNCAAIPESLFESELFGHEAGAFTGANKKRLGKFEYAHGGTLFLDEIESMPLNLQVKILRTLQEGAVEHLGDNRQIEVDVRVIAATKIELKGDESFRQDLFYRLNVGQLYIPPLRERQQDIPLLFEHFSRQETQRYGVEYIPCSGQELRSLQQYSWPGNVRELRNIAMRYGLDPQSNITELLAPASSPLTSAPSESKMPLSLQVHNFEAQIIRRSLQKHQGNILAVMDELDLPRRTLNQKMQNYGISRSDFRD
ncbi:MAG: sigma-54 dependent transcriptional regulator [Motiliproteus sp.]